MKTKDKNVGTFLALSIILAGILVGSTLIYGTIPDAANKVTSACNGSTTGFTFDFPITATSDMVVILRTVATGEETTLTETLHYSLSATNNDYSSGGVVTTVSTYGSAYRLMLIRNIPESQDADLEDSKVLRLEDLEGALDRLTLIVQDLEEELGRAPRIPASDSSYDMGLPNSIDRASKYLAFGATGDPTVTAGTTSSIVVSSFMETLIDDATAAAARTTLQITTEDIGTTYNVQNASYNATGDGVADDAAAIQLAIDAANAVGGGTVFFPEGTYILEAALVPYDNIRLTGSNATLKMKDATNDNMIEMAEDGTSSLDNVQIDHLNFDGNSSNQTDGASGNSQNGIKMRNCTNIRIDNCNFTNFIMLPIQALGTQHSRFTNNYIKTAKYGGISLHFNNLTTPNTTADYNVVAINHVEDCSNGDGIHVRGAHHNMIVGNTIYNMQGTESGVILYVGDEEDGCTNNTVIGNTMDTCYYGVEFSIHGTTKPEGNTVVGNTISNASAMGMVVNANGNAISANIMQDGISAIGMRVLGENNTISSNIIFATTTAIDVRGDYNTIMGNNCQGSVSGIVISTSGTYDKITIIGNDCRCTTYGLSIDSGIGHTIIGNNCTGATYPMRLGVYSKYTGDDFIYGNQGVGNVTIAGQVDNYVSYEGGIVTHDNDLVTCTTYVSFP